MQPRFSVFANVSPISYKGNFTAEDIVKTIRSPRFKPETAHLRTLINADEARIYKAGRQDDQGRLVEPGHFFGATVAGIFEGGKTVAHLKELSGLGCMDVDGLTTEQVSDLIEKLCADEHTYACFVSPSGYGVKWIVRIDIQQADEYKLFFQQLSDYLHDCYELTRKEDVPKGTKSQIDASGKNVDRLCFLPFDPNIYHNPDSAVMPLLDEYRNPPIVEQRRSTGPTEQYAATEPVEDKTRQLLTQTVSRLTVQAIDLTDSYEDWVEIGFALASLGDEGRIYFHEISRISAKYDYQQCDTKFTELLRSRSGKVNIGTFFARCEQVMGKTWERSSREIIPQPAERPRSDWSPPQPLNNPLLPVLPVSHAMIPEPLRPWLVDIAYRMKCPLDFVAATAIVMLSSLIGTRLTIKPKTRDDWTVVPNLWGAVIGGPSSMKTPSMSEVIAPLVRLMYTAREQYEQEMQVYDMQTVDYEAQKKVYTSQAQDRHKGKSVNGFVSYPETPKKPKEKRYMVNDTTVEKLADLLNENPTGLLQLRDELTGLLASWDRAGHEQDRAFHLEAWNGSGSMTIDRIGRGTTHVNVVCESLFGGIQPAKLLPYLQAATGYENDGFVQRLQVSVYPDPAHWEYGDDFPDKEAKTRAFTLIEQIVQSEFKQISYDADQYNRFPYTRFDAEAQEIFKQWLINWETVVLASESGLLLEHFTKYRSLMPSLALIFHVVNCTNNPTPDNSTKQLVSREAAEMAVRWCEHLQAHTRRIYGLLDTVNITAAKELLRHLKAGDLNDGFKVRDVTKKGWTNLTTADKVDSALAELIANGWIQEIPPDAPVTGRPEAPHYLIHPKIYQNV